MVLTKYLNVVPYGTTNGTTAVGVEAASRMFFDKPAKSLTLDQAALIAGLQAPSQYNPFYAPQAAKARRNDVLQRMAKQKMITQRGHAQGAGAGRSACTPATASTPSAARATSSTTSTRS